ncbi:MAG: hypothetical protein AAF789_04660 [Bacteroidota bacterium]
MHFRSQVVFFLLLVSCLPSTAQRIEIDRLERDFRGSFRSREAYELSQKFIQIDSTYYTGYYFEGLYRFFRASDLLGYQLAIKPLRKGLQLMEDDFRAELRRIRDIQAYIPVYELQRKYAIFCDLLIRCYSNVGELDKSIAVIRKLIDRRFIYNWGVDPYAHLSWIHHKNRVYTSERYAFLKPSIEQNVKLASKYADSILIFNRNNYQFINQYIPTGFDPVEGSYWHYKDIIYSYLLNVDSAEISAQNLRRLGNLSLNNYGNLQFIQAKFEDAERNYNRERDSDGYQQKETKEFDYMQSVIHLFKNEPQQAVNLIENSMDMMGPAPGYGWNAIAKARALYYAGDLEESKAFRDKAANFKELHINSTWGKVQYEQNSLLFEYLYHHRKIREIKFRDKYYWLDVSALFDLAGHYFKKENAHLLLTSELSANPERFLVLYNVFASENTIFFDEIWELIKDFNPAYFVELFEEKINEDQREGIVKYLTYLVAKFYLEDDEPNEAIKRFESILEDPTLDIEYEKLLIARTHEGLTSAYRKLEEFSTADRHFQSFFENYPQLVPFSEMPIKISLDASGLENNPKTGKMLEELQDFDIEWSDTGNCADARVWFEETEDGINVNYEMRSATSEEIAFSGGFNLNKYDDPSVELVYRLFGIKRSLD